MTSALSRRLPRVHPFFRVETQAELSAARAVIAGLPAVELLSGWSLTHEEWVQLRLPAKVLHPGVLPALASALSPVMGLDLARLRALMRRELAWSPAAGFTTEPTDETGSGWELVAGWLREAGLDPAAFTIEAVPLPPASALPEARGIDGRPRVAPLTSALLQLGIRELEARYSSEAMEAEERRADLQAAVDHYVAVARDDDDGNVDSVPSPTRRPLGEATGHREGDEDPEMEWPGFDPDGPPVPIELRFEGERVLMRWSTGDWQAYALGDAPAEPITAEPITAEPITAEPPRPQPHAWSFTERSERSWLSTADGREHLLVEVLDYPVVVAPSPDGTLLWVTDKHGNGGVFQTDRGTLVASAPAGTEPDDDQPMRWIHADGSVVALEAITDALDDTGIDAQYEARESAEQEVETRLQAFEAAHEHRPAQPAALGVVAAASPEGHVRLVPLHEGWTPSGGRLAFPYWAAAFDEKARRYALATDEALLVFRVEDDARVASIPLRSP